MTESEARILPGEEAGCQLKLTWACYISAMSSIGTTDLFLSLTPEKVLAAVEAGGLATNPVCYPLTSFENRVYEVELQDRTRLVAKFYRPGRWSEEQILEEHQFLTDLDAEEVPVATVRPFPDGG